jgi:hypothetical protein
MGRKHKMHLRHITLQLMPSAVFKVSCGASAEWTVNVAVSLFSERLRGKN